MKHLLLAVFFWCIWAGAEGQKYDNLWMLGINGRNPPDSNDINFSVTQLDFTTPAMTWYRRFRPLDMRNSGVSICDKNGNLQFYANGIRVYSHNDEQMSNGFGLNPGQIANQWGAGGYGYPINHGCLGLQLPGSDSLYYLFHTAIRYDSSIQLGGYLFDYMYYSVIDMSANNGLGGVIDKNHILISDSIVGGYMSACKHANGRDWWIMMPELMSNCFYTFLLTSHGIDTIVKQCVDDTIHLNNDAGSNCFTPDGSKYIRSNPRDYLNILDFDRCSGQLSNPRRIFVVDSYTVATGTILLDGVAVSPNSKYLYLSTGTELRQYDLSSGNIQQSEIIIDNTLKGTPQSSLLFNQLGADGKIYINPDASDTFLHVINYPDLPGLSCNFVRNAIKLPTWNGYTLPYYPNYRLGPLLGSACDSLPHTGITEQRENTINLKVFPNPATDYITIDYGITDWSKGDAALEITNELGHVVHRQSLPRYSGFQKIDVSDFASGLYMACISAAIPPSGGQWGVIASAKFAKQ